MDNSSNSREQLSLIVCDSNKSFFRHPCACAQYYVLLTHNHFIRIRVLVGRTNTDKLAHLTPQRQRKCRINTHQPRASGAVEKNVHRYNIVCDVHIVLLQTFLVYKL